MGKVVGSRSTADPAVITPYRVRMYTPSRSPPPASPALDASEPDSLLLHFHLLVLRPRRSNQLVNLARMLGVLARVDVLGPEEMAVG